MLLHHIHQHTVLRKVAGTGHSSRKYHHVLFVGARLVHIEGEEIETLVGSDCHAMRRHHERILSNGDKLNRNAPSPEDVGGGEGLDVLEAFRKKNIHSFHSRCWDWYSWLSYVFLLTL